MSDAEAEWQALFAGMLDRAQVIARAFEAAGRKRMASVTVATFHCAARRSCTLLTVWTSPEGLLFYRPRYRLSPAVNAAESSESGRRRNTEDGERRWLPNAGNLDALRGWGAQVGMPMNCDHVHATVMVPELFPIVDRGAPGAPVRHVVRTNTDTTG